MLPQTTRTQWLFRSALAVLVAVLSLWVIAAAISAAAVSTSGVAAHIRDESLVSGAGTNFPNCRFGVGGGVVGYDVASLNAGWYMDWSTQISPARPNGIEYAQLVRFQPVLGGYSFTPSTATLLSIISANPGSIWLVGNEPDSPWQNNLVSQDYARAYHQVYNLIKQSDPSARIGVASIVEPTPVRLQYLNAFVTAYQQMYGGLPPADFWSIHSYILREIDFSDPQACQSGQICSEPPYSVWGAYIPTGLTATRGILYTMWQMFSQAIFQQRLLDFRTWMSQWGYRDTPLYITELGELFPYPPDISGDPYVDENGVPITEGRVAAFMTGTFNILTSLTDTSVGYPADANRLVQRWIWYSVSDGTFGGALFDPTSHTRRPLGNAFAAYTSAISPSVDLLAVRVVANPATISDTGQLQTTTLKATISNIGNVSIEQPITVAFYSGWPPTGTLIGSSSITLGLGGCATMAQVSMTWPNLGSGAHPMYMTVDPGNTINEASKSNNTVTGVALIATQRVFLALIFNKGSP
jgi:Glycosyl hydrolase catalytic core/CARDB